MSAMIALVLWAVFGLLGFGWRSWLQRQRTGSNGFRGIHGRIGSAEWAAGVGFAVALAVAVAAPVLQLCGVIGPSPRFAWLSIAGAIVAVVGIAATVWAQIQMGDSWRIGVDDTETTALVRTGVFGRVRNPIYTAMLTSGLGITLVAPNLVAIGAFVLLIASMEVQVRRVEEPYLLRKHGNRYRDDRATVGRFIPGVGLDR